MNTTKLVRLEAGHYVTENRRFRIVKMWGRGWTHNTYWQVTDRDRESFPSQYSRARSRQINVRTLSDARRTIEPLIEREGGES